MYRTVIDGDHDVDDRNILILVGSTPSRRRVSALGGSPSVRYTGSPVLAVKDGIISRYRLGA